MRVSLPDDWAWDAGVRGIGLRTGPTSLMLANVERPKFERSITGKNKTSGLLWYLQLKKSLFYHERSIIEKFCKFTIF